MQAPTNQRPYRVCEACGRLTPTSSPWCAECGVASEAALELEQERQDEHQFAEAFFSRNVWITWAFVGANLFVFAMMVLWAGTANDRSPEFASALVRFGARVPMYIDKGDYWRFVTPVFLHSGILHLTINVFSLWVIGAQVERLYGASRFVVLYMLSGMGGGLLSYVLLESRTARSAGASGALAGLVGVLLVFAIRYRSELPGVFRQSFSIGPILFAIVVTIVIGLSDPALNNTAHLGGLLTGIALALVFPYARKERRAPFPWLLVATLLLVGVSVSFAVVSARPRPEPVTAFVGALNSSLFALERVDQAFERSRNGALTREERVAGREQALVAASVARTAVGFDTRSDELFSRSARVLEKAASEMELAPVEGSGTEGEVSRARGDWQAWIVENSQRFGLRPVEDASNQS